MKKDYYKSGDWSALCDVCGRKFKASKLLLRWDNHRVCKADYEERHIADFFRGRPDDQSVAWTRSDDTEGTTVSVGDTDTTLTVGSDNDIQYYRTALTANRTITLDTTGARWGNRFIIYRSDGAAFTLDVGGLQTIPASLDAVVTVEYNGTIWILIDYTLMEI